MDFASEFEKWRDDPRRVDPPPVYGPDGSRANTPEVLFRQELARERSLLLKKIRAIEPSAATALGDAPARPSRRLYIPQKEFPNVCFMGLILGPRGNHHKRMEAQTGCRIRVRGRGSLREGSRGRDAQRDFEDDQDDMHVFVEGPTEAQVQEACALIEPLLNPESGKVDELSGVVVPTAEVPAPTMSLTSMPAAVEPSATYVAPAPLQLEDGGVCGGGDAFFHLFHLCHGEAARSGHDVVCVFGFSSLRLDLV